jgi:hypothetical protein
VTVDGRKLVVSCPEGEGCWEEVCCGVPEKMMAMWGEVPCEVQEGECYPLRSSLSAAKVTSARKKLLVSCKEGESCGGKLVVSCQEGDRLCFRNAKNTFFTGEGLPVSRQEGGGSWEEAPWEPAGRGGGSWEEAACEPAGRWCVLGRSCL